MNNFGYTKEDYDYGYIPSQDITVIFKRIIDINDPEKLYAIQISGFHFGKPDKESFETFKDSGTVGTF